MPRRKQRDVDIGGIHAHPGSDPIENALQRDFGLVIRIGKVLGCRQNDSGLQKTLSSEERGQTVERLVNPLLLLVADRKLRLGQAKHAVVYNVRRREAQAMFPTRMFRDFRLGLRLHARN